MTDKISFHLVSPEKKLLSSDVMSVSIPGMEGDMTILPKHADFLTVLRPGIIQIRSDAGEEEFVVTGGFVEVSGSVTTVLAEKALGRKEAGVSLFEPLIDEVEKEAENAKDKFKARAELRLNDLKTMSEIFE